MTTKETYIDVSVWSDQTGEWFDIHQAYDRADALAHVARLRAEDGQDDPQRYRITTTTHEEA